MKSKQIALLLACLLLASLHAPVLARAQDLSPTTGLPTDQPYQPVLVQLSNSMESRPHWGLADADVVYEAVYWGPRHTRYLAIFNDHHPEMAGPLRPLHAPVLVRDRGKLGRPLRRVWLPARAQSPYWQSLPNFDRFHVDFTRHGGHTARVQDRVNPHNAVFDVAAYVREDWPINDDGTPHAPQHPGLRFADPPSRGSDTAVEIDATYHEGAHLHL